MGEAAEIITTDDIGVVAVTSDTQNEKMTLYNAVIIDVSHLDAHRACLQCKARVEPLTPPFGRCSKPECKMLQRFDLRANHTTAKLMLMHQVERQNKVIQVHAFGEHLEQIVGDRESVTPEQLLKAPQMSSVTIAKSKKIIRKVNRQ